MSCRPAVSSVKRPSAPIDPLVGVVALARRVVERPIHHGGESFRDAFLNDELADVRRRATSVPGPTASPIPADCCAPDRRRHSRVRHRAVREIASEPQSSASPNPCRHAIARRAAAAETTSAAAAREQHDRIDARRMLMNARRGARRAPCGTSRTNNMFAFCSDGLGSLALRATSHAYFGTPSRPERPVFHHTLHRARATRSRCLLASLGAVLAPTRAARAAAARPQRRRRVRREERRARARDVSRRHGHAAREVHGARERDSRRQVLVASRYRAFARCPKSSCTSPASGITGRRHRSAARRPPISRPRAIS